MPRVGYLGFGVPGSDPSGIAGLRQGLRELGYVEHQNIIVEYRYDLPGGGGSPLSRGGGRRVPTMTVYVAHAPLHSLRLLARDGVNDYRIATRSNVTAQTLAHAK
jgi:hypothetical protein